jgi:molybdopterin biosynthesis enzyme
MLAAALYRKRPAEEPVVTLELPTPPKPQDGISLTAEDTYTVQLNVGESVVLGRNTHGRLGEGDAKFV